MPEKEEKTFSSSNDQKEIQSCWGLDSGHYHDAYLFKPTIDIQSNHTQQ